MLFDISDLAAQGRELNERFFADNVDNVAIKLIGAIVVNCEKGLAGQIIDTEAYCNRDPAAHCFHKKEELDRLERLSKGEKVSRMHDAMYGPPGTVYIYPGKGIWCALNFVCGKHNRGAGVLVRAMKPLDCCIDQMRQLRINDRKNLTDKQISAGPNTVCRALGILPDMNNRKLEESGLRLFHSAGATPQITTASRIRVPWKVEYGAQLSRRYIMDGMTGYHSKIDGAASLKTDESSIQAHCDLIDARLAEINAA